MNPPLRKTTALWVACVAVLAVPCVYAMLAGPGQLIHREASLYSSIFVYRNGSVVTLQFGRRPAAPIQSQVDLDQPARHMLEYTKLTFCGLLYQPEPRRALVLGLGGGVIPRQLRRYFPDLEIDVVEIDPAIPPIASRFMGFATDDKLRVHVQDGRMFIKKQLREPDSPKYDLIILDAFNSEYIPFHLMTREFLEEVQGVLADDGVVVANVFYSNRLFDAELRTFLAVFDACQVYTGIESTNAMLAAPARAEAVLTPEQARTRALEIERQRDLAFSLSQVATRLRPDVRPDPRVRILTDDRAPVNWLRNQPRATGR